MPSRSLFQTHASAYVSIRQHTSAYRPHGFEVVIPDADFAVFATADEAVNKRRQRVHRALVRCIRQHTSAYATADEAVNKRRQRIHRALVRCIRQHTSAYGSIRQHPAAYGSIRQHTSPSIPDTIISICSSRFHTAAYVSIRQHTSAYVSIRQHTSAYVSIRRSAPRVSTDTCC
jgi:hypothetical protein